jgi:hypothetical protein
MAVTAQRIISIQTTGDIQIADTFEAEANASSPAQVEIRQLASGNNTITPPSSGCITKAVTIIPPAANATVITAKGVGGDTGIAIHVTDPTTIALNSSTATFVLSAAGTINGVRLIWT